jgi:hypothetical protein
MMKNITIPKKFGYPTVNITVNGIEYTLETGVEIEVDDHVAEVVDNALALEPKEDPNAGGGSGGGTQLYKHHIVFHGDDIEMVFHFYVITTHEQSVSTGREAIAVIQGRQGVSVSVDVNVEVEGQMFYDVSGVKPLLITATDYEYGLELHLAFLDDQGDPMNGYVVDECFEADHVTKI